MNLYSLGLFAHIIATVGLFAGIAIELVTLHALKRASPAESHIWIGLWPKLLPLTIASAVLLIGSGMYLAAASSLFDQGWIQVSMLALVIIAPLGAIANRAMRSAERGATAFLAVSCRTAIALGVTLLMTIRPDRAESFVVFVTAATAGLFYGLARRNGHRASATRGRVERRRLYENSGTGRDRRHWPGDRSPGRGTWS
ncbi:MAG TPA: hypothetical protein VKB79_28100 [Bryobacteraceae bacterium]|nr:hypothetical protein [Bryobacteraceae bacterium]